MKAIVFVDVQNDFVKEGKLAYVEPAEDLLPYIKDCAAYAREVGMVAYATKDVHDVTEAKTAYADSVEGRRIPSHCIDGTPGCAIVSGLCRRTDDDGEDIVYIPRGRIIKKSSFAAPELPYVMGRDFDNMKEPIEEIYICGFCTSICVISNALLLRSEFPDAEIKIVRNLCGDLSAEAHEAALVVARNNLIDTVMWTGEGFSE